MHFVVGSQYAWGAMAIYIVGYFRMIGNLEANMSQFYLVLPLIVIVSTVFFPLGMETARHFGSRTAVAIGGTIIVLTTFCSTFTSSPTAFFIVYAVGFGIGKGFLYPAPLVAGWSHLEDRKGLVSGMIVSGLGFGAFSFGLIVSFIVNPDNLVPQMFEVEPGIEEAYFESVVSERVPRMLHTLSIIYFGILLIGFLAMSNFKPTEE